MLRVVRPFARAVTRVSVPTRLSSGFAREDRLAQLLQNELNDERGKGSVPAAPEGWALVQNAGKIEMTLKRDSGEATVMFSAVEEGAEDRVGTAFVVLIDKPNAGTVAVKCITDPDHLFTINQVAYYGDSKLAHDATVAGNWAREESYEAPIFNTLDDGVQAAFHEFVQEHGVDSNVTGFIEQAAAQKEQVRPLPQYLGFLVCTVVPSPSPTAVRVRKVAR